MSFIGVTTFIKQFKEKFDAPKVAKKLAKEKGCTEDDLLNEWANKREWGIKAHDNKMREFQQTLSNCFVFERSDGSFEPTEKDEKLTEGIHLERPIWTMRHRIIGYPDRIDVIKNKVFIEDYKTWDEIKYRSSSFKVGTKVCKHKFFKPIDNLDDCNYKEAALQLSFYMRIILDNNPNLVFGGLKIRHLQLVEEEIVSEELIEVPYLRQEVQSLLDYKKLKKL